MARSPLTITCPGDQTAHTTNPNGTAVTYPAVTVRGGKAPYKRLYSKSSGSVFPIGTTVVDVMVTDRLCQIARCTFTVDVLLDSASAQASASGAAGVAGVGASNGVAAAVGSSAGGSPVSGSGTTTGSTGGGGTGSNASLMTAADLTFRGMWRYPEDGDAHAMHLAQGPIGVRYVSGQRRILTTNRTWVPQLLEWSAPTSYGSSPSGAPDMTYVRGWNDVFAFPTLIGQDAGVGFNGWTIGSLWWDEARGVVWYTIFPYYSAYEYPFLGATKLNNDGSTVKYGMWYYKAVPTDPVNNPHQDYKAVCKWIGPLPSNISSTVGGRTMYLGGDVMSIGLMANFGPGIFAVNLPNLTDNPAIVAVEPGIPLAAYNPVTSGLAAPNYYAQRETDYNVLGHYDAPLCGSFSPSDTYFPVSGGIGRWAGSLDYIAGALPVQTASKEGVVVLGRRGIGRIWYGANDPYCNGSLYDGSANQGGGTGPHAEAYEHSLYVYDPADLRRVAQGVKRPWEVQFKTRVNPGALWGVPDFKTPALTNDGGKVYTPGGGSATAIVDTVANQILWQLPITYRPSSAGYPTIQVVDLPVTRDTSTTIGTRVAAGSIVRGPQASITPPAGAVSITAGSSIQTAINNNPAGTAFYLRAGTHSITASIVPKTGNTFVGELGAIIDGTGWSTADTTQAAFRSHLAGTINNVTIRNLVIRNMPQRGVHAWWQNSTGWLVEYCEIHHCLCGVSFPGASIVRNNYIHHCTGDSAGGTIPNGGYISTTGTGSVFEQNEVSYCGETQKVIDHADNVTFRQNWFHHNTGVGIWYDGDCINAVIEDNTIEDNGLQGVMYEISAFGTIRYNTIRRNGDCAIFISNARDNDIHHNNLTDNFRGIILLVNLTNVWPANSPYTGALGWDLRNNSVHDNNVTLTPANLPAFPISNGSNYVNAGDLTPYSSNTKNNTFTKNHYFHPVSDAWLYEWGVYKTFAQWQALGHDVDGTIN